MMKNKQMSDALNTLDSFKKKIIATNDIIAEFHKGGQDIKFEVVKSIGSDYIDIAVGVSVCVTEIIAKNKFILHCKMKDGAELSLHKHSNYSELFKIIKGILFDIVRKKGYDDTILFDANEPHQIVSIGDSEMYIECTLKE